MGNFSNNAITDVGKMLLADVQAGAVFTPTRIVIGSGSMSGGATVQGITDVITPVKSLAINKKKRTPDGKCVFGGVYTNEEVTEPFYFRELALYAKAVYHNEDGSVKSEGAETLYSYGNAGATADYMPAYSTSTVVEKQMDLVVWVGNDAQVDLTIESGVYITHEDFDSHAARHAADGADPITPESIGAAPAGYGLGLAEGNTAYTDANEILYNGWYKCDNVTNTPFTSGWMHVSARDSNWVKQEFYSALHDKGPMLVRFKQVGTWGEWEWVNPIMDAGVVYRTTERRHGRPVYKILGDDGVLKYRLEGEPEWKTYAKENGAAPDGYGLGGMAQLLRGVDLNDITGNGWYSWSVDCLNIPFDSGSMLVINRGGEDSHAYAFQIAFYDGTYDAFVKIRKKTLGTWGEWKNWNPGDYAPAGYGLGSYPQRTVSLAELDSVFDTGWYMLKQPGSVLSGVNLNYGSVLVHCIEPTSCVQELRPLASNVVLRRVCHQNVWYEWEVENPPMDVGVEYRTTERYKGAAVYKKVDAAGNILWRAENETSWRLLASANVIAPASVE